MTFPRVLFVGCLLALAIPLAGCARLYQVTFTRGSTITVRGKPKYDPATDTFTLTDLQGRTGKVRAFSVSEIAPAGQAKTAPGTLPIKTAP